MTHLTRLLTPAGPGSHVYPHPALPLSAHIQHHSLEVDSDLCPGLSRSALCLFWFSLS